MRPRVLQFIGSFHQGGSERQAVQLARSLKAAGEFEVFVATLDADGPLGTEVEAFTADKIAEFRLSSFYGSGFLRQLVNCSRYLKANQIDLVHSHDFYTNVFGMFAARLAGIGCRVASKRETGEMRTRAQDRVEKTAFRLAHRITANSEAVRDRLVAGGISPAKISVVYNGLELSRFLPVPVMPDERGALAESFGLPRDEHVRFVTMVANLRHTVKNHPMLLRTAERLAERFNDVHFVVAGEGALEPGLRQQAEDLGVGGRVHFIGRCSRVPELLSLSTVGVLTSFAEGFSNSILEYMAASLPVVATGVGGAAEAVEEGVTGYLVGSGDDEAMAERLSGLLADPARAAQMGRHGREIVRDRFSSESRLAAITELYYSLYRSAQDAKN